MTLSADNPAGTPPPIGTVVRWRTSRTVGLGQLAAVLPDRVVVRAWLPSGAKEVVTTLDRIVPLPELTAMVEIALGTVRAIQDGLNP